MVGVDATLSEGGLLRALGRWHVDLEEAHVLVLQVPVGTAVPAGPEDDDLLDRPPALGLNGLAEGPIEELTPLVHQAQQRCGVLRWVREERPPVAADSGGPAREAGDAPDDER